MSIGLAGPAGAGKDEVGKILAELYDYRPASFAFHLRLEIQACFELGYVPNEASAETHAAFALCLRLDLTDPFVKPTPRAIRELLVCYGDWRRSEDPDYFVERAPRGERYVYTDVRYKNEFLHGMPVWYVYRPEAEAARGLHRSEQLRPQDCHWTVFNDGTLEDLRRRVISAYTSAFSLTAA